MERSFWETSVSAWSQLIFFHLPPSSFIGVFRRCESWVMPCSRIDAPLAQCAPRLIGESDTGSWRIQTPSCTTASMAQPTEQCVQTVRLISTLPASSLASAVPIWLRGSGEAAAAAPAVTPERRRNVRRSIVLASARCNPLARRDCTPVPVADFLVSSMATSSDLRGAVVVADVLARLVAARRTLVLVLTRLDRGGFRCHDRGGGGRSAGAHGEKEITAGQTLGTVAHGCLLLSFIFLESGYAHASTRARF